MSTPKNADSVFMPHGESRRSSGVLGAINAELVHELNGDESAVIFVDGTGTFAATYVIEGSPNGTDFYPLICFPYAPASLGGTLPQAGQPLYTEAVSAASIDRMLCCAVGGLRKMRIRLSAYTSGTGTMTITSDACASISPYVRDQKAATLMVTTTGAAAAAVTCTLPAVTGLRHYIDAIRVTRIAAAALTAAATPVLVTTTNLPGAPVLSFPADAAAQGSAYGDLLDFGGAGAASIAISTATTVVCPATTGVIWRVNVAYRLGL